MVVICALEAFHIREPGTVQPLSIYHILILGAKPIIMSPRTLFSLILALAAAAAALLLDGLESGITVLVIAAAAVLVASTGVDESMAGSSPAPANTSLADADELIEAIFEPVLIVANQRVVGANRAARALLGQHILQQDIRLAIRHPAAAERLLDPSEIGSSAPVHLVGLGAHDQRWEMRVRDISGSRRLVHLIDRSGSHAAEKMRVDFVANASHELRTPLASLLGFIETLNDEAGAEAETRTRFLKIMHDEAVRMQRLVDDLISLSRIEADKHRPPHQLVNLPELIHEVQRQLTSVDPNRGKDLEVRTSELPDLQGDKAQLSQLLYNIVGNAMKYGRIGTSVRISLQRDGAMAQLRVADESDGITPEHLPRLTERFYRVDPGRSRAAGGTGLGLAIVKHIVERHRGRLDIASTVGQGTTVTVSLPIGDAVIKA